MKDHVIICGFGTKGRAAADDPVRTRRTGPSRSWWSTSSPSARGKATSMGMSAVAGSATTQHALRDAGIARRGRGGGGGRPRRRGRAGDAHRPRAEPGRAHRGRGARGRERPPAARGRRELGDHVVELGRAAARARHDRRRDIAAGARGPALRRGRARHRRAAGRPRPRSGRSRSCARATRSSPSSRDGELLRFDDPRAAELRPGDALVESRKPTGSAGTLPPWPPPTRS